MASGSNSALGITAWLSIFCFVFVLLLFDVDLAVVTVLWCWEALDVASLLADEDWSQRCALSDVLTHHVLASCCIHCLGTILTGTVRLFITCTLKRI